MQVFINEARTQYECSNVDNPTKNVINDKNSLIGGAIFIYAYIVM